MSDQPLDFAGEDAEALTREAEQRISAGRSEEVTDHLLDALIDRATWKRARALGRLAELPSVDQVVPNLTGALGDDLHPERRNAARTALARLAEPDSDHAAVAIEALAEALRAAATSDERLLAATVLGESENPRGRPALEEALGDVDPNVASAAAEALGHLRDQRAVPALLQALRDSPFWVQAAAVVALGELGDERALDGLADSSASPPLASAAIAAIGKIGGPKAIDCLRRPIHSGGSAARAALYAAARILAASTDPAIPHWLREAAAGWDEEMISRLSSDRDLEAARLLGVAETDAAVEALVDLLYDPHLLSVGSVGLQYLSEPRRRSAVTHHLEALPGRGRAVLLELLPRLGSKAEIEQIGKLLGDEDEVVRAAAAELIGHSDPDLAIPYLEALLGEPTARLGAALALSHFGRRRCDPLLGLLRDPDPSIRRVAARSVGHCIVDDVSPLVEALETEGDPTVLQALLAALGSAESADAVAPLTGALDDDREAIRFAAVRALGRTGQSEALPPLLRALDDASSDVRMAALIALGDLRDPGGFEALDRHLSDEQPEVRRTAARSIQLLSSDQLLSRISQSLDDEDEGVRMTAIETLRRLGDPAAATALTARLESEPSPALREAASRALVELGGLDPTGDR